MTIEEANKILNKYRNNYYNAEIGSECQQVANAIETLFIAERKAEEKTTILGYEVKVLMITAEILRNNLITLEELKKSYEMYSKGYQDATKDYQNVVAQWTMKGE